MNRFTMTCLQSLVRRYSTVWGGAENGRAGYNMTHSIAYIRDYLFEHGFLGETFETSVEWGKVISMTDAVKRRLIDESCKHLTTTPFLSYRVSQIYNTGVCIYFTFGFYNDQTPTHTLDVFHKLAGAMRETMAEYGGSISHHHGIGQWKANELIDSHPIDLGKLQRQIKSIFDLLGHFPNNNWCWELDLKEDDALITRMVANTNCTISLPPT
jgi:alkyldihydroxyacetonephosphate synthase